jgi:hypothetical protein
MAERTLRRQDWAIALVLFVLTFLLFARSVANGYVDLDDGDYVFANAHVQDGVRPATLRWAMTAFEAANWHPLTWMSHALDYQIFGLRPAGHHLTSVVLHSTNVVLLFLFLYLATGRLWSSAFAAALFGWHPLRVEAVAWISERKEVLCGLFFLSALLAWQWYARRPSMRRYVLTLLLGAAGLLAKPTIVTLPFVLLLLDFWPLGRINRHGIAYLVLEKLPFLLICAVGCFLTWIAQSAGGAMRHFTVGDRMANAVMSYARYLGKTIYPTDLLPFYGRRFWLSDQIVPVVIGLVTATAVFALQLRRRPYLIVGWLWFLGILIPTIGLVHVGAQSMADRYTYLPSIGLAIMLAWGAADCCSRTQWASRILPILCVSFLGVCMVVTWRQIAVWHDTYSMYSRTLHDSDDRVIDHFLGWKKQLNLALLDVNDICRNHKGLAMVHCDWGDALLKQGRLDQAIVHYQAALRLDPAMEKAARGVETCRSRLTSMTSGG